MSLILIKEIAARLKTARISAGFKTSKDFALSHNIPASTYSQHETGKRSINIELILLYCKCLEIEPNWLLMGQSARELDPDSQFIINGIEYKLIDIDLLKMIFKNAELLFNNKLIKLTYQELVDYCFDVYGIVSTLSTDKEEKEKIIKLTISSVKQGAGIDANNEDNVMENF